MSGETNLQTLIASMEPVLDERTFVFATLKGDVPNDTGAIMMFREAEGTTLVLRQATAEALDIDYEFPCRMITLNIHSALDAVGFLAAITNALAKHGMGVNPVSGFFHDHLFIPEDRVDDAMAALRALSANQSSGTV